MSLLEQAPFTVDHEQIGHTVVVRAAGELDGDTVGILEEALTTALGEITPPAPLVLDLTGLTFMSSRGIAVLLDHDRACAEAGASLVVVAVGPVVRRPLQITGVSKLVDVRAHVEDALSQQI